MILTIAFMMMPTVLDERTTGGAGQHDAGPRVVDGNTLLAQITIEQRIIIRVPMARPSGQGPGRSVRPDRQFRVPQPSIEWDEEKGPKCVGIRAVRAAAVTTSRGVDLMLRDGTRLRAHLSRECRSADLWSGFYIQPHADGDLCAGRDEVLARGGQSCEIEQFRRLVPEKP